jgi:hypothetical protein
MPFLACRALSFATRRQERDYKTKTVTAFVSLQLAIPFSFSVAQWCQTKNEPYLSLELSSFTYSPLLLLAYKKNSSIHPPSNNTFIFLPFEGIMFRLLLRVPPTTTTLPDDETLQKSFPSLPFQLFPASICVFSLGCWLPTGLLRSLTSSKKTVREDGTTFDMYKNHSTKSTFHKLASYTLDRYFLTFTKIHIHIYIIFTQARPHTPRERRTVTRVSVGDCSFIFV